MSYWGDSSSPLEIQRRVVDTFRRALGFARDGKEYETLLACDFILRLDAGFEPARRLQQQTLSGEPINAADLRALAGLDAPVETTPKDSSPSESTSPPADISEFRQKREKAGPMDFRRSVRVPLSRPYRVDVGSGWEYNLPGGPQRATGSDLCEGGMFVNVASPLPPGSEIDFEVQIAGTEIIEGRGEVAWVFEGVSGAHRSPGMGVRFINLRGNGRRVVRHAMDSIGAEQSSPDS